MTICGLALRSWSRDPLLRSLWNHSGALFFCVRSSGLPAAPFSQEVGKNSLSPEKREYGHSGKAQAHYRQDS